MTSLPVFPSSPCSSKLNSTRDPTLQVIAYVFQRGSGLKRDQIKFLVSGFAYSWVLRRYVGGAERPRRTPDWTPRGLMDWGFLEERLCTIGKPNEPCVPGRHMVKRTLLRPNVPQCIDPTSSRPAGIASRSKKGRKQQQKSGRIHRKRERRRQSAGRTRGKRSQKV